MFKMLVLFLFIMTTCSFADSTMLSNDFSFSIPHYSVRLANISRIDIRVLEKEGFLIEWAHDDKATVYVNADQEEMLRYLGFNPKHIPTPEPLVPYPSITEIYASIDAVVAAHSDICRSDTIGYSWDERPIIAVVVSDNPSTEEIEPELRMHGAIHGDEKTSAMVTLHYLEVMTDNYPTSPMCEYIVNNAETWIIPVLNPDGYENTSRFNARGVDLNRNLSYMWAPGSSHGTEPFSERETAALRDLTMQNWPAVENFINPFVGGLSLHGGAACINTVWNYTTNPLPEDYDLLDAQCDSYVNNPGIVSYFGSGVFWIALPGASWYAINGDVNDWSYGECGTIDHTIEVHDHKLASDWPGISNAHYMATLEFFTTSTYGVWGTVKDIYGDPIDAMMAIGFSDAMDSEALRFCRTDVTLGDYHKTLIPGTYDIEVSADGYVSQSVTDVAVGSEERVEVSFVLYNVGIEDSETGIIETGKLTVYPNPAHESLNISLPVAGVGGTVLIYDITGRSVYSQDVSAEMETIVWNCTGHNGSEVPSGMYIARFDSGNSSWTTRLMITR